MQNVKDDAANGLIDIVVHMGDHCYNLGMNNDRRGDAYMNAFQPALTSLPWFPIIGPESFPLCVDLLARGPTGDEVFLKAECAEPEVWDRSGKGCSTVLGDPAPYVWPIGAIAVLMVRRRRDHAKEER